MTPVELKEALILIKSGKWFSMRCITADVQKGTGGSVLEFPKVRLSQRYSKTPPNPLKIALQKGKQPRHHVHFTMNMELPNGLIRKIHPALITHINNSAVL